MSRCSPLFESFFWKLWLSPSPNMATSDKEEPTANMANMAKLQHGNLVGSFTSGDASTNVTGFAKLSSWLRLGWSFQPQDGDVLWWQSECWVMMIFRFLQRWYHVLVLLCLRFQWCGWYGWCGWCGWRKMMISSCLGVLRIDGRKQAVKEQ